MSDEKLKNTAEAVAVDPLAIFEAPESEQKGIWIDVEDPRSGEVLMKWNIARFGGSNNTAIVREERALKSKLPSGVRRQIDAGGGDPEVVLRLNRQVFVRVSCLGWEMVHPSLKEQYGEFSFDAADKVFEKYARMYDLVAEAAAEEQNFAAKKLADQTGN